MEGFFLVGVNQRIVFVAIHRRNIEIAVRNSIMQV
jgi:hypothetical protein